MSSLNRPFLWRVGVLLPLLGLVLLGLGGCIEEVRPLYGSGSFLANGAQAEKMQSVAVDEISGVLATTSATICSSISTAPARRPIRNTTSS